MNAYKLAGHQHVCEIERELGMLAGEPVAVTFTAQVVPVCRGIMSTLYADLKSRHDRRPTAVALYREFYTRSALRARLRQLGRRSARCTCAAPTTATWSSSVDERANRLRVVSYIDNLVKGQAGSALQNMNLLFGLPETAGLEQPLAVAVGCRRRGGMTRGRGANAKRRVDPPLFLSLARHMGA